MESFACSTVTKDGYPVLIGGFSDCRGVEAFVSLSNAIKTVRFGGYRNPDTVDLRFANILREAAQGFPVRFPHVLAGVILIPGAGAPCGAILGSLHEEDRASDEEKNPVRLPLEPAFYSICYPGKAGIAVQSSQEKAVSLAHQLDRSVYDLKGGRLLDEIKYQAKRVSDTYVLCSDISYGDSGTVEGGEILISDSGSERLLAI